jgi:hypothetical protein
MTCAARLAAFALAAALAALAPLAEAQTAPAAPRAGSAGGVPPGYAPDMQEQDPLAQLAQEDARARRASSTALQATALRHARGFAEQTRKPGCTAAQRLEGRQALSMAFSAANGPVLLSDALEPDRKDSAKALLAYSAEALARGESGADLGLRDALAYYADPASRRYDPALAMALAVQLDRVLAASFARAPAAPGSGEASVRAQTLAVLKMLQEDLSACRPGAPQGSCMTDAFQRLSNYSRAFGFAEDPVAKVQFASLFAAWSQKRGGVVDR